jgi:protein phosphatase
VQAFGATHTGRVRAGNEDAYLVTDRLYAVADGMGGHQAGEIASDAALEPLRALDIAAMTDPAEVGDALAAAVHDANTLVVERARSDPSLQGMGTTLTAVAVREGQLHVAHVGDSRAYLLRDGERMSQLTTDHTLVERLVREGRLSRDQASTHPQRNVITRAIGHEATVDVEVLPPITLRDGDQILLCSDGLSGPVDDERIAGILTDTADGDAAVTSLLAEANAAGGPDNITAVLVRVGDRWEQPSDGDDDASSTQQLAVTQATNGQPEQQPADEGGQVTIDTRPPASDEPWAQKMGRIGAPQGVDGTPARPRRGGDRARIAAAVLGLLLVVAVLVGGGWFLLSRSYYVGEHNGMVAVFRGLPQEVLGTPMSWVIEEEITTTPVDEFPVFRQRAIAEGLTARSLNDARRIVEDLQQQLRDNRRPPADVGEPLPGSAGIGDPQPDRSAAP